MKMTMTIPKEWSVYLSEETGQEITSAKTARMQRPRTFKVIESLNFEKGSILLDVGCGNGNAIYQEAIESIGLDYNGCDPFNKSTKENMNSIKKCMNGKTDIVTLNNVLNTVSQEEIRNSILKQCKNALNKETGLLFVLIYEGTLSKQEKDSGMTLKTMTPKKTRDGWQNRWKTEKYFEEVSSVFENVKIVTLKNVKVIMASRNPNQSFIFK